MPNGEIWPPPPENQPLVAPPKKVQFSPWVLLSAAGLGLLLGIADVHLTGAQESSGWAENTDNYYLVAAGLLGLWQPKTFWLSACLLTLGLYGMHVAAITMGVTYPYVERDVDRASGCLFYVVPNGIAAFAGAAARFFWNRK